MLKTPITQNVKDVDDPNGGKVFDQMVKVLAEKKKDETINYINYGNLGSGSDYASFYQFVGTY